VHIARCGIYGSRPQFCKDYPQLGDAMPSSCTFHFEGDVRRGSCMPEKCLEHACCNWPREGGVPDAPAQDAESGGRPCKHLVWADKEEAKTASADLAEYDPCEAHQLLLGDMVRRD